MKFDAFIRFVTVFSLSHLTTTEPKYSSLVLYVIPAMKNNNNDNNVIESPL